MNMRNVYFSMLISAISGGLVPVGQCSGLRARCAALEDLHFYYPKGPTPKQKYEYLMSLATRDNIFS